LQTETNKKNQNEMANTGLLGANKDKAISLDDLNEGMSAEELNGLAPEEQKQETETATDVKEEIKTEEAVVEQKTETVVDDAKKESETEQKSEVKTEESTSKQFDFRTLNEQLGRNYSSVDQIKADIEKPTMESEYNDVKKQLEEWQAKYNELNADYDLLTEQIDPTAYFSSEEAMKLEAFKKANPDKDASIAQKVFSTNDLSSISDIEMVKMGWKFNTPNLKGTDKDLEVSIAEELGQDPETPFEEWPISAKNRLARMSADYANQFKQIRSSVSLPEKVNIEELKTQRRQASEQRQAELTEGWSKVADESLKSTSSVKLPIGKPEEGGEQKFFVWELGDPPQAEVDTLKERYISMGVDPKEHSEAFQQTLDLALIQKNLPQIMQKYGEDLLANIEEKHLEETNNTNPLKDSERTDLSDAEKEKAEQTRFAREDVTPRFIGQPLFIKK